MGIVSEDSMANPLQGMKNQQGQPEKNQIQNRQGIGQQLLHDVKIRLRRKKT